MATALRGHACKDAANAFAMSLSICCLTNAPGERLASILERLRPVADEIVVGADSRVEEKSRREYATIADIVLSIDFEFAERHMAILVEQCSGDWILRVDDDEVPSSGLVERLPWLMAQQVEQYWLPRRWLYPTPDHWLDELPWWPDYHNRLVRRSADLRFSGMLHTGADPVLPAQFLEWPLYHLECIFKDRRSREAKVTRAEGMRPGLTAPGGGPLNEVYYLPERYARRPPRPVPPEDRAPIAQMLRPSEYAVIITPVEHDHRFEPGERRAVHFRVHNTSSMSWLPNGNVRLSYRWIGQGGEGERTPFTAPVTPGNTAIVALTVTAPSKPGRFGLEVDLVHEHVRWFQQAIRVDAIVGARRSS